MCTKPTERAGILSPGFVPTNTPSANHLYVKAANPPVTVEARSRSSFSQKDLLPSIVTDPAENSVNVIVAVSVHPFESVTKIVYEPAYKELISAVVAELPPDH